jgi:dihydroxy-acid dehydratase
MACDSQTSCEGCSCSSQENKKPINIEDCQEELLALRRRTQQLESKLASLKIDGVSREKQSSPSRELRSRKWFGKNVQPEMGAIYLERYLNYGITREELTSGKPIIGIAQSGSDLVPCNRYHLELSKRIREGIRSAGGIAFEFPIHPIQESSRRPTACLDRNFAYLGLVEILYAYPLDGVVLLTGCDKTTPACLMAAATMVSISFPDWVHSELC